MRNDSWSDWYTPRVRLISHIFFWLLVIALNYLNYARLEEEYVWVLVFKELVVCGSLFYSASFFFSKWATSGKVLPVVVFLIAAYVWWSIWTYITYGLLDPYIPSADSRFYRYLHFIIDDGYFALFTPSKLALIFTDFMLMVSIPLAPKLMKLFMDSSLKSVKLERDNLQMELKELRSQVSPHFLFNSLNSVYRMAETGHLETAPTIQRLSNLLRYLLYQSRDEEILLEHELNFIRDFVELGRVRFGQSVVINFEVDSTIDPFRIPPLMLIPFVENAFKHGPERSRKNAWIDIKITVKDEQLIFTVRNGVNTMARKPEYGGVGLPNVKRRLELNYPDRYVLDIRSPEDEFIVELKLKLKN